MNRLEVFEGADRRWYWRLLARNGRTIATGGEGFMNVSNAKRAAGRLAGWAIAANLIPIRVLNADAD